MMNDTLTQTKIVSFYHHDIVTTITKDPNTVTTWITETTRNMNPNHPLIIGLDTEWRASFEKGVEQPIAILQLCSGDHCLIFQIIHAPPYSLQSLFDFLNNPNYTFMGVGIDYDAKKLVEGYGLGGVDCGRRLGGNMVDLRRMAVEMHGFDMRGLSLDALAREIIRMEPKKLKRVTLSRWDNYTLSPEQIEYACVDAMCSFEIGRVLISRRERGY